MVQESEFLECTCCGYLISNDEFMQIKIDPRCPRCDMDKFSEFETSNVFKRECE